MAENETLDLGDRRNRRWRFLCDEVVGGASAAKAAQLAERCVTQVMKNIARQDKLRGGPQFPVAELLDAIIKGPREVARVLDRCDGHQYAHLLAEERGAATKQIALERFFGRVVGNFIDQVALKAVPARFASYAELAAYRNSVDRLLAPGIKDLARRVADNPEQSPRHAPIDKGERFAGRVAMLRESLLPRVGVLP